jgi:hypothetical protein
MTSSVVTYLPRRGVRLLRPTARLLRVDEASERSFKLRVYLTWGALFLNVVPFYKLTWNGEPLIIHIPGVVGKLVTQGALIVAFLLALSLNRRLLIRPNVFMGILTLLVIEAVISGVDPAAGSLLGTTYRTCRLAGFVGTLWLLTPLWDRRDMLLLKAHLATLFTVLGTVVLGLLVAPSRALAQHRLSGEFWPITPVQVSDYSAVALGIIVVLWFCGVGRRRALVVMAVVVAVILLLTHTRTELIALGAGIVVAGLRMYSVRPRVRWMFAVIGITVSVAIIGFSGALVTWLQRGENSQELNDLSGRTNVWTGVLHMPRDRFQVLFGFGLSNKGYSGLPIDSTWIASYYDLGLIGIGIVASMLIFVLVTAYFRPQGTRVALALFLVTYIIVTSYTETGISDASPYLLELVLAASLLAIPRGETPQLPSADDWLVEPSATLRGPA